MFKYKEREMFKYLGQNAFLRNAFLILLVFVILWAGSFIIGRCLSMYLLKGVPDETLKLSFRSIITCGFQICIFFVWVKFIEKRKFSTLGFNQNKKLYKFLIGFFIGVISITIITFILFLVGAIQIEIRKNITMSISTYIRIVVIVVGWLVQSISEEIGIRGWLIPHLGVKHNLVISILSTSIIFAVLHLFVPTATVLSFVNIILSGIFFALYALSEDCLWGVWGCHFGSNLTLGNVYAFTVSGFSARGSAIFNIKVSGNSLLTGGSFGPEGGVLATLTLIIGIIICSVRIKRSVSINK